MATGNDLRRLALHGTTEAPHFVRARDRMEARPPGTIPQGMPDVNEVRE